METPIVNTRNVRWGNYIVAFLITALIFATALYTSSYFNDQRLENIRAMQDTISTDILSLETQFDLLQERSCEDISENTVLSSELRTLANQLSYMEARGSRTQDEVLRLKRLYSLLQIKDYLLMKKIAAKCNLKPVFMLYFYSNKGDCDNCAKQGYVLTALAESYPQLRIYSFDYNLDVSALQTLISIVNVRGQLPALIINGKPYYGFQSVEDINKILPQLATLTKATSTATTSTKE